MSQQKVTILYQYLSAMMFKRLFPIYLFFGCLLFAASGHTCATAIQNVEAEVEL